MPRHRVAVREQRWHSRTPSCSAAASRRIRDSALAAYEQMRRERVEAIVRAGARSSSAKIPGRVGRVVQETLLRAVFASGLAARSTNAFTAHRLAAEVSSPD